MEEYKDTFNKTSWKSWTYHNWESLIDMLSKLRKQLSRGISRSLDLQMHHKRSMENETLSYRKNDKVIMENDRKTRLNHKKRRVKGR